MTSPEDLYAAVNTPLRCADSATLWYVEHHFPQQNDLLSSLLQES